MILNIKQVNCINIAELYYLVQYDMTKAYYNEEYDGDSLIGLEEFLREILRQCSKQKKNNCKCGMTDCPFNHKWKELLERSKKQ